MSSAVPRKFPHIRISILWLTNNARYRWSKNSFDGFSLLSNQYISNISNLYNPDVNMRLASQTKCDKMFSDPKSDNILSYFQLSTWFIYIFFSYVIIIHLIWKGEGDVIYCKLIPYWIGFTQARILFPDQYITRIYNQIRNNPWKSISKYHGVIRPKTSLYLDSLVATVSWVFSPRLFTRANI